MSNPNTLLHLVTTVYEETGDFCTIEVKPIVNGTPRITTYIAARGTSSFCANGAPCFKEHDSLEEAVAYLKTYLKEYSHD